MIQYIILHWTGGNFKPSDYDKEHYQLLIDDMGRQYVGKPSGTTQSVGGMNSITYNIAVCGGLERTPILPTQIEAMYKATARVMKDYKLIINRVYTHAEIGEMCRDGSIVKLLPHNKYLSQNIGKIDLTNIPCIRGSAKETGDFIRNKVKWYLTKV